MELKWRQSTTTFGGPHSLCCKNGLSFSIAYCSLFSLCLFPLLDRERSKRVSKEWQLQKKFILWDTRKRSRQTDTRAGRGGRWACGARQPSPEPFLLQLLPSDGVNGGNDQTARQEDSTSHQRTASQAKGGKSPRFFTLTPRLSFHFENGILIKWSWKRSTQGSQRRQARKA